jgi:hypothetical protein
MQKMLRIVVVLGNHRSVPSPALYAIAWAPYLHGCVAGMEHFLETVGTSENAFARSMRHYTANQWPARRDIIPDHCCSNQLHVWL